MGPWSHWANLLMTRNHVIHRMREKKDGLLALGLMQVREMFDGGVQARMKCSFKVQRSEGPSHI